MLITTKENIKKLKGITVNDSDVILASIAMAVSMHVEKYLMRHVHIEERTELHDVACGQEVFSLKGYPVTACAVYNDYSRLFPFAIDQTGYTTIGNQGQLIIDRFGLVEGYKVLKVVYTGGLALTQVELETNYPDIEMAARIQGAFWFDKKDKLGISAETIAGGGQLQHQRLELLPTVKEVLNPYRNVQYV